MELQREVPRPTILVVDDHEDSAVSIALLLTRKGNHVEVAYDGRQAIEIAETLRPQVILLDISLPGLSGYEVAGRMRQRPWGRDVVLVAMTGLSGAWERRRSLSAGFDHHLVKPIDTKALYAILASIQESPAREAAL